DERWQIPVCVKYVAGKAEGRECTLMTSATAEIALTQAKACPDYVFPNADEAGYYRAVFKGAMLGKVIKDGGKRLSLPERVGLVGDVSALVENGSVSYADALQLISPLLSDGNRFTVTAAISLVGGVRTHLVSKEVLPNYRRFVKKTFGAKARDLGFVPRPKDD